MKPTEMYAQILQSVTDDMQKKVLEVLIGRPSGNVTRRELVLSVFGEAEMCSGLDPNNAADNPHDRAVRRAIEQLRKRGFPIVSTSGEAGYRLVDNPDELDACIAEEYSRIEALKEKVRMLHESKGTARRIRVIRETSVVPEQVRMF